MGSVSPVSTPEAVRIGAKPVALSDRALGLLIMSVAPALFWVGLIALIGWALGSPPPGYVLALGGAIIAAFLAMLCSALIAKS